MFKDGTFRSVACDRAHFSAAAYSTTKLGDAVAFSARTESPSAGSMTWQGTVKGSTVIGTAVWQKTGEAPVTQTFDGTLQP